MATTTTPNSSQTRNVLPFVVRLLAGPVVWAVYFILGYLSIEAACKTPLLNFTLLGMAGISVVVIGLTVVALVLVGWAGAVAYGEWHKLADEPESSEEEMLSAEWLSTAHKRFMSFAGLMLSILFGVVILATGLPAFLLWPC